MGSATALHSAQHDGVSLISPVSYLELENKCSGIRCDAFVCMPNPIHVVIFNVGVNDGQEYANDAADNGSGVEKDAGARTFGKA